jgi:hypothetical protein
MLRTNRGSVVAMTGGQWLVIAIVVALYGLVYALAKSSRMRDDYERASHAALLRELRRHNAAQRSRRRR